MPCAHDEVVSTVLSMIDGRQRLLGVVSAPAAPMQRYFFHLDQADTSTDLEGTLFASLQEAREAAVQLLGQMLAEQGDGFWDSPSLTLTVEDAEGMVLWRIEVSGIEAASVSSV